MQGNLEEQVRCAYEEHIRSHMEENRRGAMAVREWLDRSPLHWNGCTEKTLQIPKVYSEETIEEFREIAETTHRIFGKVIREYRRNPEYRALFPFSRKLEELILLPPQYEGELPIARFDIFHYGKKGDFRFCEINTDGTAAMLRDLEMGRALIANPAHQAVLREFDLEQFELFDSWVRDFLELYATWPNRKKERPYVVIVDFLENATLRDFEEYARRFQRAGILCEICDIRSLTYRDGVMYSASGMPVDAVYRRAVTADVMAHEEEVQPLFRALRDDAVFMAGAFDTQVIHTKWLFYVLHHPLTEGVLTEEELAFVKAHVPLTVEFTGEYISLEEVRADKDRYILKPMDSYSSKGVYAAGREYGQAEWDALTGGLYGTRGCICQEYCPQHMTQNIDLAWGDGLWHPCLNMPGLYTYRGKLAGILSRMAVGDGIIVAHENERTVPTFVVKGKRYS